MIYGNQALQTAIIAASNASTGGAVVLRDMGKTIQAPYGVATSITSLAAPSVVDGVAFFRQVQLLNPTALSVSQGALGGLSGSTFGVLGAQDVPSALADYLTFYIPVTVAGVRATVPSTKAYAIAGGQM
jgi:hypothetical protein